MIEDILTPHISPRFASEEKYRLGHIRVINPLPEQKVLGLHIPDMKKIAADLAASENREQIIQGFENVSTTTATGRDKKDMDSKDRNAGQLSHEEKTVWGLILDKMKVPLEERLEKFGKFVPAIDNWAICDTVCSEAKWAKKRVAGKSAATGGNDRSWQEAHGNAKDTDDDTRRKIWEWLGKYYRSGREFEVRFAVVMSMCHFLEKEWLPRIFNAIEALDFDNIRSDYPETAVKGPSPYYLRMGVAWLLATALAKYPEETRDFVNRSRLPENVIRLYKRKARESFRTRNVPPL